MHPAESYNISKIAAYEPSRLSTIYQELIKYRMMLDKTLSEFLHKNEDKMGEDVDTKVWRDYKAMNKTYSVVAKQLVITQFYMNRGR